MRIQLNLMPQAVLRRRGSRARRGALVGIPLAAIALMGLLYAFLLAQEAQAGRAAREAEQFLVPLRPLAVRLAQLQTETEEFDRRRQQLETQVQQQAKWSLLLEDVARFIPRNAWLQTLQLEGGNLVLTGGALTLRSAADFAEHLARSPAVMSVTVQSLQESGSGSARVAVFEIRAVVRGSVP